MAALAANVKRLDGGFSVQVWCPTAACAMRVVDEILSVNPDAFGAAPFPTPEHVAELSPAAEARLSQDEAADDPEPATSMGINNGTAYMANFGSNPVSQTTGD